MKCKYKIYKLYMYQMKHNPSMGENVKRDNKDRPQYINTLWFANDEAKRNSCRCQLKKYTSDATI